MQAAKAGECVGRAPCKRFLHRFTGHCEGFLSPSRSFLGHATNCTDAPIPNSAAIFFQPRPCARRALILALSTTTRGRPSFLPLARALRRPGRTRSAIRLRSSSATPPRTVKAILRVGVPVSTCSESETNSMPRALNVGPVGARQLLRSFLHLLPNKLVERLPFDLGGPKLPALIHGLEVSS